RISLPPGVVAHVLVGSEREMGGRCGGRIRRCCDEEHGSDPRACPPMGDVEHQKRSFEGRVRGGSRAAPCTGALRLVLADPRWRRASAYPRPGFVVPCSDHTVRDAWRRSLARDHRYPLSAWSLLDRRRSVDSGAAAPVRSAVEDRPAFLRDLRWRQPLDHPLAAATLSAARFRPSIHHGSLPHLLDDGEHADRTMVLRDPGDLRGRVPVAIGLVHELGADPVRRMIGSHLAVMMLATTITFGLGVAQKAQCMTRRWVEDKTGVAFLCDTDIPHLYAWEKLAGGRLPYLDSCTPIANRQCDEYPAGTMYLMRGVASATGDGGDPYWRFSWAATLILYLCALWITWSLERMRARTALFAAAPVLITAGTLNWDMVPVALATAATLAYVRGRDTRSGALLGLGAFVKVYPGLLAIPFAL